MSCFCLLRTGSDSDLFTLMRLHMLCVTHHRICTLGHMLCVQRLVCMMNCICFCMMQSCCACCIFPNTIEILSPETNQGMCMRSGAMPQLWDMKSCTSLWGCWTPMGTPLWGRALHLGSCLRRHPQLRSVFSVQLLCACFIERRAACFSLGLVLYVCCIHCQHVQ